MDNYFEHIQDYLDDILSPEDRQRFEEELARNANLRSETDHQRSLRETLGKRLAANEGVPAFVQTLQTVSDAHFSKPKERKRFTVVRWLIPVVAAACLLLVFILPGRWSVDYEALPDLPVSVTRGVGAENRSRQAAEAFNAKDYQRSIQLLQPLIAKDTTQIRYRYYLGLSYLGLKDYRQSADVLSTVADGKAVYADDARYFLAVALWRLDELDEALRYAERVTSQSEYHRKARKLVDQLAR